MAVDESGQERKQQPSQGVVPPSAQALSSAQIEAASAEHPIFRIPHDWGDQIQLVQKRVSP